MNDVEILFGHQNFGNYRRLAYKWWFALAEFVDNSTQSYFNNRTLLDAALVKESDPFTVRIATDKDKIRVTDNAMGMDLDDIKRAMMVGVPPDFDNGRCRYGLGMKTAACWIGDEWKIITTKLGSTAEFTINVNVDSIVNGDLRPPVTSRDVPVADHHTVLEITTLNRPLVGRTVGKIKDYLTSIYRFDLTSNTMVLTYNDDKLEWTRNSDDEFLKRKDGTIYRADFIFEIPTEPPKVVEGWVGVLDKGSRSRAGFSILHRNRMISGWPDSWRPEKIFGHGGRNDLVNQRVVGEVNLEDFEVSHTKDEINWYGKEEELVEEGLLKQCRSYIDTARKRRKGKSAEHGPTPVEVDSAVRALEEELSTSTFLDKLSLESALPPSEQIALSNRHVVENAVKAEPAFSATLGDMAVKVYIDEIGSPNDPYFVNEVVADLEVVIVVNSQHPHWSMLEGENAVLNYLRHCVYDGVAEHRAAKLRRLESDTVKRLKDTYLRVAFEILQEEDDEDDAE